MREKIQTCLSTLTDIDSGKIIADDIVIEKTTYFGYDIAENYQGTDLDNNYTYRVNITGYVTRLVGPDENTQEVVDNATKNIIEKLKELNFKCNSQDITLTDDLIKTEITGYTTYNEINNKFIV